MKFSRRDFLATAALTSASLAGGLAPEVAQQQPPGAPAQPDASPPPRNPVIICKPTGMQSIDAAYEMLRRGGDTLAAVLHICRVQEDDPLDDTVGLGGLPNEEGEVELDACCMHGPSRRAGAVGGLRNIKNASLVARAVMEHTGHVMLVGEGAQRFALAQGFPRENLLTERSRKIWMLWKESHSDQDWWGPGPGSPGWKAPRSQKTFRSPAGFQACRRRLETLAAALAIPAADRAHAVQRVLFPATGTIHVSALNAKGEMSGATSTCGLSWKLPGRVGDSPIPGAGCWTDQDVGAAGATGSGEENIKVAGAHTIVENMRHGMPPRAAGLEALQRIVRNYNHDLARLRYVDMVYYILRKDGAYAGVSLWSSQRGVTHRFAVHDGKKRLENCVPLLPGDSFDWPPTPALPEEGK